ncbi:MAG: hypothetical protein ACI85N_001214 [Gammaproteobacteria bacterium]|jgi:hypothetical protein
MDDDLYGFNIAVDFVGISEGVQEIVEEDEPKFAASEC